MSPHNIMDTLVIVWIFSTMLSFFSYCFIALKIEKEDIKLSNLLIFLIASLVPVMNILWAILELVTTAKFNSITVFRAKK